MMDKFDRTGKSGPMFCVEVLSNLFTRKVGLVLAHTTLPLEIENLKTVDDLGTQTGCLRWHSRVANREYDKYIGQILGIFGDVDFLTKVGFRKQASDARNSDYFDEKELCTLMHDLARESIALELQPMRVLCGQLVVVV